MSAVQAAGQERFREGFTRREVLLVFSGLLLAMLTASLNQTIVSTALPTIVGDLGGVEQLSWVVTAYLLASTVSTPIWGKLGDIYGRKPVFQVSIVVFLAGSLLSGLSQDMLQLVAFRAMQGLGGGGLIVGAQTIVADVVPPRERGRYQGFFGAAFGASSILGPLLGGFFVDSLSWRWSFYANVPLGLLALAVTTVVLRLPPPERGRHEIDYLGAALLTGGVTCLVLLTTLGGNALPWRSPQILLLGAGGILLLAALILVERRAAEPILPLSLFRDRTFAVSSAVGFVVGFALFGVVTFLPLFLQVVGGVSPTVSGLQLTPMTFGLLLTSIVSGQLISRWGRYKIFPILGTAITAVGLFLLSRMGPETDVLLRSLYFFVVGFGLGLVMQVLVLAVQNAVDYRNLGAATSAATFFRSIGGSFGVAIFGAVFSAQLAGNLPRYLPPGARTGGGAVQADPSQLAQLPQELREAYVQAFAASLDTVFLAAVPFAILAFILSWFLDEVPLRKTVQSSGMGESYAMPRPGGSLQEIERALSVLVRRENQGLIYEQLAQRAGVDLPPAETWLLLRIEEYGPAAPPDLADRIGVPEDRLRPYLLRLRERGLIASAGEEGQKRSINVSTTGQRVLDRLLETRRRGLEEMLEGWSPRDYDEISHLLGRLSRELLRDDPEPVPATPPSR